MSNTASTSLDLDPKTRIQILKKDSVDVDNFSDNVLVYIEEILEQQEIEIKAREKKLARYLNIIKQHFPEDLCQVLPYYCKEQLVRTKDVSKSRYAYILHYKGKVPVEDIIAMFNKPYKELKYGYDESRDETVVYAEYSIAKQCTGCATFAINDIVPYGAAPKRDEKAACKSYVLSLKELS